MALFQWNNSFSVNNVDIDKQHKKLVELINSLHDAMGQGKSREVLGVIFNDLISYTKSHFKFEENCMLDKKYPDYTAHRLEHQKLTNQVLKLKQEFDSGKVVISIDLLNFLKDWLKKHILESDKKYVPFFN
ncbi:MAG: bacteriohemerythrin [Melioribacteraceae bacterium]|nr:MAG: bacteriohemerythrin [Melioribacteraceae bacterium]